MASVQCFAILTTDPRGVCWAGGTLEGKVVLNINSPLPVTGIRMMFYGEGRVEWTDGHKITQRSKLTKSPKTRWKDVRTFRQTESYSKTTTILYGTAPDSSYHHILPAGNHTMPFQLPVPSDLPSSFEGCHGYVRYWLECILDIVGHVEQITKKAFTVISMYNLNTDLLADKEIQRRQKVSVSCACGSPGYYDIRYKVARRGYVPGEKIMIDIKSRNNTKNTVHLVLRFKMITSYHAEGKTLRKNKVLHEGEKLLESAETLKWNPEIPVPPLPPSGLGGSRVIDVRYWLEADIYSEAYFTDSMHLRDEIKIGTIPLTTTLELAGMQSFTRTDQFRSNQLLPIGYPTPQIRSVAIPAHPEKEWLSSDVESGGSSSRFPASNGQIRNHSIQSSSLLW